MIINKIILTASVESGLDFKGHLILTVLSHRDFQPIRTQLSHNLLSLNPTALLLYFFEIKYVFEIFLVLW